MKIVICSFGRSDRVITSRWLRRAEICVPESQGEEYEIHNPGIDIITIPDDRDGNCPKKRNAVLDLYPGENIVLLDDDIKAMGYHEGLKMNLANQDQFWDFCENMFVMCEELETVFWGVNQQSDRKFYREFNPFSFSSPILGPFQAFRNVDPSIRYDERIWLKEDYDMSLMVLNKYRRILRCNKWFYQSKHILNSGGLMGVRNSSREQRHNEMLQKKWGSKIVLIDRMTQGGNPSINPIIKVPIKGI